MNSGGKMKLATIVTLLVLISACGQEQIIPAYESQNPGIKDLSFKINLKTLEVDEVNPANSVPIVPKVPIIGGIFKKLGSMLVDLKVINGTQINLEPIYYEFYELDSVDFEVINNIKLNGINLSTLSSGKENLDFIKEIKIYLELPDNEKSNKEESLLVLSYNRDLLNKSSQNILNLNLKASDLDWKVLLKNNRKFVIHPKVIVDKNPNKSLDIEGSIKFNIKVNIDKFFQSTNI